MELATVCVESEHMWRNTIINLQVPHPLYSDAANGHTPLAVT